MRKLLALLVGGPDRFAIGASRGRRIPPLPIITVDSRKSIVDRFGVK